MLNNVKETENKSEVNVRRKNIDTIVQIRNISTD